ncbi:hypothetical protein FOJ82_13410 [Tessaracoccus rhinocerotis]|uniref:Uncharacterized protein n=1 Tax=Tessaracoccus rhinocerotis TaxID=1689449 RepID=A0A553JWN8_9ACTN|nr:DUF5663 domain-containing protein [Tessaracoccus rhinocerotis]TRY16865.1 hypothetical protein FOJ82_13410 [Tessaracoccus rhinocerotis]
MTTEMTPVWLAELGLVDLTPEEAHELLGLVADQLELRVGNDLSEGMTDEQLDEFDLITQGDPPTIKAWASKTGLTGELAASVRRTDGIPGLDLDQEVREWATGKWLAITRPDHKDVVKSVMDQLASEIRAAAKAR